MDAPWTRSRRRTGVLVPGDLTAAEHVITSDFGVSVVGVLRGRFTASTSLAWPVAVLLRWPAGSHLSTPAGARVLREALALCFHGVDELRLLRHARGKARVERARVAEAATAHLGDLGVVAHVEGSEPPAPAHGLRVIAVARLARRQDRPHGMELSVLAE